MQHRLRRNAANVETGAAERLVLLDDRDLHAELRGADRAHVAAGSGTDDDEVVGHWVAPSLTLSCPGLTRASTQQFRTQMQFRMDRVGSSPAMTLLTNRVRAVRDLP